MIFFTSSHILKSLGVKVGLLATCIYKHGITLAVILRIGQNIVHICIRASKIMHCSLQCYHSSFTDWAKGKDEEEELGCKVCIVILHVQTYQS